MAKAESTNSKNKKWRVRPGFGPHHFLDKDGKLETFRPGVIFDATEAKIHSILFKLEEVNEAEETETAE